MFHIPPLPFGSIYGDILSVGLVRVVAVTDHHKLNTDFNAMASSSASSAAAPVTPVLDGAGAVVSEGITLFVPMDVGRVTNLESSDITMRLRMDSLGRLVEEQGRWLQRQSEHLSAQSSLIEAMAVEAEWLRGRIRVLEDSLTLRVFGEMN